ncbi:UNVERIFIED_CONTAM: hypothetical protein Sradi_6190700 [Sesamum radiatum]|uniref:URB1 C-terminal domain-containing protein n=1 Tax=Sesamum radiatum TaxID=300843 RepID=A0AAW2K8S3_SESRA
MVHWSHALVILFVFFALSYAEFETSEMPKEEGCGTTSSRSFILAKWNRRPWQRIPSIIAMFVAEASWLWMLRMLYAGVNTEDDAQIYVKNSIFEILMSFYSSPLSDNDSKELIIQIVKKAAQLHKAVWFLVRQCGLILWLSSIVSSLYGSECQERKEFTLTQLTIVLEIIKAMVTSRVGQNYAGPWSQGKVKLGHRSEGGKLYNITQKYVEWLQKHAMEQLSELSSHLYKLLVGVDLIKEQRMLCDSILQILTLMLKISQKRRISTTFYIVRGGFVSADQGKLLKFLRWTVTTALQSKPTKVSEAEDSDYHLIAVSEKKTPEDSLVSKLLRWLTASVILRKISCKLSKLNNNSFLERQNLDSLQSLLEYCEPGFGEDAGCGCEDVLAASIFYLLQMLGFRHALLPSAVSALCLLLFSESPSESEFSVGLGISLPLLCSKIHCPAEANPAWRW